MKETVHANIGSQDFIIDQDAYNVLKIYLDDIRNRLPEDDTETMGDIELRIAELFREQVSSPMLVVTLEQTRAAMTQMGSPAEFGSRRDNTAQPQPQPIPEQPRKLYRSRTNCSIGGVCAGFAEYTNTDPSIVRLATFLMVFFGTLSIWIYIILWIVVPMQPDPNPVNINYKK